MTRIEKYIYIQKRIKIEVEVAVEWRHVIDLPIVVVRDNFVEDEIWNIAHNHSVELNRMNVVEIFLIY
jgi:hypothetical protein